MTPMPSKQMTSYVMGKRIACVMYGNWVNPTRAVFMFSGNCSDWLASSSSMVQYLSPNDVYIFFDRPGYTGSDNINEPFYLEGIAPFTNAVRGTLLEAIETQPAEIVNFGHSAGGFWCLVDILSNKSAIQQSWILVDPFLPREFYSIYWFIRPALSTISWMMHRKGENRFMRWIRNLLSPLFAYSMTTMDRLYFKYNNGSELNLFELIDSMSFYPTYSDLIPQFQNQLKLCIVGFTAGTGTSRGFATYPQFVEKFQQIAACSIYNHPYTTFDYPHDCMSGEASNVASIFAFSDQVFASSSFRQN